MREANFGTGTDRISGDVTSMGGDVAQWKKYANALRMRYAMRISDVNPQKAKEEFEKAVVAGAIASANSMMLISSMLMLHLPIMMEPTTTISVPMH